MSKIQDFNSSTNLLEAILWQYNEAEHLIKIVENKNKWYNDNITQFWNDWYRDVFNVDTANDFGLSVWAKILNVNFSTPPQETRNDNVFGFGDYFSNFYQSNFSPVQDDTYQLSLEQKRLIIKLTYQKYHILPSVPEINKIIRALIAEDGYIVDGLDMTTNLIVLTSQLDEGTQYILDTFDLLPRPAGVGVQTIVATGNEFGFEPYGMNFFNGFFAN